ncbi:hypothetical protein Efla_003008 [Eimeria flavescens]
MGFGGKRRSRKEPEVPEVVGPLWYVVWLLGLAGVAVSVASMCLPDWRQSVAIDYKYMFRSQQMTQSYAVTKWGLYNISFDGGKSMVSWPQRVSTSTEAISNAVSIGQQQTSNAQYQSWAAQCPSACQDALTTRLSCYTRISNVSTLLLGTLALGGALVLIGIGWFFLFGKMAYLMVSCWFLAGLICFAMTGYWVWETNTCWRMIILSQQFPLPKLSLAFYLMILGSSLYLLTSLAGLAAEMLDRAKEKQMKEMQKQQALMETVGSPDAFAPGMQGPPGMPPGLMGGPPGMMGGMGPPGMMGGMGPPGMMGPMGMGPAMARPSIAGPPMGAPGMPGAMGMGFPMGRPSMMGPPGMGMGPPGMMGVPGRPPPMRPPNMRPPMEGSLRVSPCQISSLPPAAAAAAATAPTAAAAASAATAAAATTTAATGWTQACRRRDTRFRGSSVQRSQQHAVEGAFSCCLIAAAAAAAGAVAAVTDTLETAALRSPKRSVGNYTLEAQLLDTRTACLASRSSNSSSSNNGSSSSSNVRTLVSTAGVSSNPDMTGQQQH